MIDKNGVEIKTGAVVRVSGGYFKNSNGLYFVTNSPGDVAWCGRDHALHKISKSGKVSGSKDRVNFWPLFATVSDHYKCLEAQEWNRAHAEIEVLKDGVKDVSGICDYFDQMAENSRWWLKMNARNFGEESESTRREREIVKFYEDLIGSLKA